MPKPSSNEPFRIWVPAGSVGDDAFSAALVLLQALPRRGSNRRLRVFATARDAAAVDDARHAFYDCLSVLKQVPTRWRRYLKPEAGGYRIGRALRESCIFAVHDLAESLPFVNLDAIYCPLALARWPAAVQKRALSLFHFALKPGGLLLLGQDAPEPAPDRFKRFPCRARLYARLPPPLSARHESVERLLGRAAQALRSAWREERGETVDAKRRQDELVAMVSHELRTPLASILGFTETLKSGVDDPRQSRLFLNTIEKNAERMLATVEGLLGVVDSRARSRHPAPVDLSRCARAAAAALASHARKAAISVRVEVESGMLARADPADLPHIIENLIGNAIKYNRRGGQVVIGAVRQRGRILLSVSDTGVGIPAASLERVFERFYRCGPTSAVKGSGLGLAIVRGLVEANGGSVRVESSLGVGSTFFVELPDAQNS